LFENYIEAYARFWNPIFLFIALNVVYYSLSCKSFAFETTKTSKHYQNML